MTMIIISVLGSNCGIHVDGRTTINQDHAMCIPQEKEVIKYDLCKNLDSELSFDDKNAQAGACNWYILGRSNSFLTVICQTFEQSICG